MKLLLLLLLPMLALPGFQRPCAASVARSCQLDVRDFGARGDGKTLDTAAINAALEECHGRGGGTVYLTSGTYLSGTVHLKSNVTLSISAGATLLGSPDYKQYDLIHYDDNLDLDPPNNPIYEVRAFLYAQGAENIAIEGQGLIDGGRVYNSELWEKHIKVKHPDQLPGWIGGEWNRGPHAIALYDSERVLIRDVKITDSANYAVRIRRSRHVTIDNLHVAAGWDGINVQGSNFVTIFNCHLETGDDAIAAHYNNYLLVTNCVLNSSTSGLKLGGGNKHVIVSNSSIYGPGSYAHRTSQRTSTEVGLYMGNLTKPPKGSAVFERGATEDIKFVNLSIYNVRRPFFIRTLGESPRMQNVTIDNVSITAAGKLGSVIEGADDNPIKNVSIRHLRIEAEGGVDSPNFPSHASGFQASNISDINFQDVSIQLTQSDRRPVLVASRIEQLNIDNFHTSDPLSGAGKVSLDEVGKVEITHSPGLVSVAAGEFTLRELSVDRPEGRIRPPFRVAETESPACYQSDDSNLFYIRPVSAKHRYADEYDAIYLKDGLPEDGTVTVRVDNPDHSTGWPGRAGIVVRNDAAGAFSPGYVVLGVSPSLGWSLQWDGDGDGILDAHTPFDGYSEHPNWLKLERQGATFTGYYRTEVSDWVMVGSATVPGVNQRADVGMFAAGRSAKFADFQVVSGDPKQRL